MVRSAQQSLKAHKPTKKRPRSRATEGQPESATAGLLATHLLRSSTANRTLSPAQRQQAAAIQQGLVGNRATADMIRRQSDAPEGNDTATVQKTPSDRARPVLPAYRITVKGKTHLMTPVQYLALRKRTVGRLRYFIRLLSLRSKSGKEVHEWWLRKQRGWMGVIADAIAGIAPPAPDMWEVPHEYLIEAERAVDDGQLETAAGYITTAQQKYNQVRQIWDRYQERTRGGARVAIKALEITRDVAFAVAGALGTVAFTPASAGLLATAGIAALVGGGLRVFREWATRCAEFWHNVRSKWDVAGFLLNVGVSAIGSFAGALVTGPLSDLFFKKILSGIGDDVLAQVASELRMTLAEARRLFAGRFRHYFTRFISGASGSTGGVLLQSTIKSVAETYHGKQLTPEQLSDKTAETFARGTGPSKLVQYLLKFVKRK